MSKLFIIATPIGNLEDITFRAIRILQNEVDIIFCEDTRQSKKLLDHYTIKIPMKSLHAHSSDKQIQNAVSLLQEGKTIAYMSDSGTPGLSDPGNKLVAAVASYDIPIIPIPGPSALTSIISICGFSGKNISFGGFLSKKPGRRIN